MFAFSTDFNFLYKTSASYKTQVFFICSILSKFFNCNTSFV